MFLHRSNQLTLQRWALRLVQKEDRRWLYWYCFPLKTFNFRERARCLHNLEAWIITAFLGCKHRACLHLQQNSSSAIKRTQKIVVVEFSKSRSWPLIIDCDAKLHIFVTSLRQKVIDITLRLWFWYRNKKHWQRRT